MRFFRILTVLCLCGIPAVSFGEPKSKTKPKAEPAPVAQPAPPAVTNHADIMINQPYQNKAVGAAIGKITLPFGWTVESSNGGRHVSATEISTETPAILTIDSFDTVANVENFSIAQSIVDVMAKSLETTAKLETENLKTDCGKKTCPSITVYRTQFSGKERGIKIKENGKETGKVIDVPRSCAVQIVPGKTKQLMFTICAHSERTYTPSLPEILSEIFNNGEWKM